MYAIFLTMALGVSPNVTFDEKPTACQESMGQRTVAHWVDRQDGIEEMWSSETTGDKKHSDICIRLGPCIWTAKKLNDPDRFVPISPKTCEAGHFHNDRAGDSRTVSTVTCPFNESSIQNLSLAPSALTFATPDANSHCGGDAGEWLPVPARPDVMRLRLPISAEFGCMNVLITFPSYQTSLIAAPNCNSSYVVDLLSRREVATLGSLLGSSFAAGGYAMELGHDDRSAWSLHVGSEVVWGSLDVKRVLAWFAAVRAASGFDLNFPHVDGKAPQLTQAADPITAVAKWSLAAAMRLEVSPFDSHMPETEEEGQSRKARDWMVEVLLLNGERAKGTLLRAECIREDWIQDRTKLKGVNPCD